jgi:flavin reductase (DIM6/NTAB) family NADH-FMN oxidoreductase RutF
MMDGKLLRRAFGAFATGVTVVTVGGDTPHGMTANSFTSVSLNPPLLLVCVGQEAVMHGLIGAVGAFGISVLASDQEGVARHFADKSRPLGKEQFDAVSWLPGGMTGAPLIDGALAHFECDLHSWHIGGDHTIFVGRLLWMDRYSHDEPLLFHHGKFHRLESEVTQ